jgi:hypothetical protein
VDRYKLLHDTSPKSNLPTLNKRIESIQKFFSKLCNNLRRAKKFKKLVMIRNLRIEITFTVLEGIVNCLNYNL